MLDSADAVFSVFPLAGAASEKGRKAQIQKGPGPAQHKDRRAGRTREHDHEHGLHHECSNENLRHIGIVSLVAIVLHNIIEGIAVYSIATESFKTGLFVALGVGLHNIPMGMVISSTLEYESKSKKILALLLATLSTFIGGIIMLLLNPYINELLIGILIALTLGMIIYIELFELIPHMRHSNNKKVSLIGILIGIIIIVISTLFE